MVWPPGVQGPARDRGRPRRGRHPHERERRAVHGALRPAADGALDARRRGARDLHRGGRGPRLAARRRLPRRVAPSRRRRCGRSCRACTTSSWSSPASTSRKRADGGRADLPLHHGRDRRRRRDGEDAACRGCSQPGECAGGLHGAHAARRELALGPARLRPPRRRRRGRVRRRGRPRLEVDDGDMAAAAAELDRLPRDRRRPVRAPRRAAADDAARRRHLPRRGRPDAPRWRRSRTLQARVRDVSAGAGTQRSFNPGWHLWMDLRNMLVCAEAIARAALRRTESRGAHSRLDFPEPSDEWGRRSIVSRRDGDGDGARASSRSSPSTELEPLVAAAPREGARVSTREFELWRGDAAGGEFVELRGRGARGHGRARRGARDPADVRARPRRALELQGREVRLVRRRGQRQAAPHVQDAPRRPARRPPRSASSPLRAFPIVRDLVSDVSWNYEVNKQHPAVLAEARRELAACTRRTSSGSRSSASASSASSARTSATCCATTI